MKIVFLLTQDLNSPSGLGRFGPLARELARRGHAVSIYALHPDFASLNQKSFREGNLTVTYVAPMHVRKQGSRKTYYSLPGLIWVVLRAFWALTRAALSERADVIWVAKPHPMNGIAGLVGKARWGCRLFIDCDDDEAGSGRFRYPWQRSIVRLFERWLPRFAERVTVNTLFTLENLVRYGIRRDKITYLPNGVDVDRFSQPVQAEMVARLKAELGLSGARVVSYIGTLSVSSHSVDLLIDAFQQLHQRLPDARLLLVGGGEDYELLRSQVTSLGLDSAVTFTGRVSPEAVMNYYRLAEVTVDPIYNNAAALGRSPLKMFEAWACGAAFVSSPVGDRACLAGDPPAALFVKPGDAQDLAGGLEKLLDDPALRQELVSRGSERLQAFTWARLVERVSDYLK